MKSIWQRELQEERIIFHASKILAAILQDSRWQLALVLFVVIAIVVIKFAVIG